MKVPFLDLKAQYKQIKEEIDQALADVISEQQFILGLKVKALEETLAAYSSVCHGIGVASGSDALMLSLMALEVGAGDEVITTPFTFFATAGSISKVGAKPVFVDIDPKTYNLDPTKIEEQITPKIKAIIPVHLFGQCADMEPILETARKYNLRVIEDAAQAIGAKYKDRKAGSMGDLGCLSFFPSKNLGGYGDGGMVVTNDEKLAGKIRVLRVHGGEPKYYHSMIGCNSRLDALQAAVLSVKLKYLGTWTEKRRKNTEFYNTLFADSGLRTSDCGLQTADIVLPHVADHNYHIYNQYTIRVKERDNLQAHLKTRGIGTALYYPLPLHLQECYAHLGYKEGDLPESEKASRETISIPVYPELTEEQQRYIVKAIQEFLET